MASQKGKSWSPMIWAVLPVLAWAIGLACGPGMVLSQRTAVQPIRLVQSNSRGFFGLSATTDFGQPTTLGNTIIVAVWGYGPSASTLNPVSDSATQTYTQVGCSNETSGNTVPVCLHYTVVTNPIANLVVSASGGGGLTAMDVFAAEFSGLIATSLDAVSTGFSDTPVTSADTGFTSVTSTANQLVIALVSLNLANDPITPSAGFSTLFTDDGTYAPGQVVYKIISSTGQQSHTWTYSTGARFAAVIATFRGF